MRKTIAICTLLSLLSVGQPSNTKATVGTAPTSKLLLTEAVFIPIARDFTLLDSWLSEQELSQEALETLRVQSHQEILACYEVDPQAWAESRGYYLEDSIERALPIYEKIHAALETVLASL
jgi:hypothetical protein